MTTYGGLVSFGNYTFPYLADFDSNFAQARRTNVVLPGLSGGFNQEGIYPAPSQAGRVSMKFTLVADSRAAMDDLRDAVRALYEVGLARLVYQPTDALDAQRYCLAKIDTIKMSEDKSAHTDLHQPVQIVFFVPSPYWESAAYASFTLDDGKDLNDGLTFGSGGYSVSASGALTSTTLTNNGNAPAWVKVAVSCGVGQTCTRPTLQRMQSAAIADEIIYNGVLDAGDELFVDGRRQFAQLNGANVVGELFDYKTIDFIRLAPGANTVRIRFDNVGDAATVRFWWNHTWR